MELKKNKLAIGFLKKYKSEMGRAIEKWYFGNMMLNRIETFKISVGENL